MVCALTEKHLTQHNLCLNTGSEYLRDERNTHTYEVQKREGQLPCAVLVGSEQDEEIDRTLLSRLKDQLNTESIKDNSPEASGCEFKWR